MTSAVVLEVGGGKALTGDSAHSLARRDWLEREKWQNRGNRVLLSSVWAGNAVPESLRAFSQFL